MNFDNKSLILILVALVVGIIIGFLFTNFGCGKTISGASTSVLSDNGEEKQTSGYWDEDLWFGVGNVIFGSENS
jgi:hypothetical protein